MRTQTALVLGIIGGLVLVGLAAGRGRHRARPSPTARRNRDSRARPPCRNQPTAGPSALAPAAPPSTAAGSGASSPRGHHVVRGVGDAATANRWSRRSRGPWRRSATTPTTTARRGVHRAATRRPGEPSIRPDAPGARQPRLPDLGGGRLLRLLRAAGRRSEAGYYAYDLGAWRSTSLNSNCPSSAAARPGHRRSPGCRQTSPPTRRRASSRMACPALQLRRRARQQHGRGRAVGRAVCLGRRYRAQWPRSRLRAIRTDRRRPARSITPAGSSSSSSGPGAAATTSSGRICQQPRPRRHHLRRAPTSRSARSLVVRLHPGRRQDLHRQRHGHLPLRAVSPPGSPSGGRAPPSRHPSSTGRPDP